MRQRCLDLERQVRLRVAGREHRCSWCRIACCCAPPSQRPHSHSPSKLQLLCTSCWQLVLLAEEKQSLAQENAVLRERVGRPEGEGAAGLTAKKLLLLQSQLEQLQEENFRCGHLGMGPVSQGG